MGEIQGPGDSDLLVNSVELGRGDVMKIETGESSVTFYLRVKARSLASADEVSEHIFHLLPYQLMDLLQQAMKVV